MTNIRLLSPVELPLCLQLEHDREWATDEAKWRLMFEVGEVYGLAAPDGDGLAGCVVVSLFGDTLAAVGMMLVATRYGRQGVGTRLMKHALDRADGRTVELTATRFGRPVYERLGFRETGSLTINAGPLPGRETGGVREATPDDHEAILAMDAEVTGADRSRVLTALLARSERTVVADGGFAIGWNAGSHRVIGPVVAAGEQVARDLILGAAQGADREIRLDLTGAYPAIRQEFGMNAGNPALPIMVYGAAEQPGDRTRYVAPILISIG